MCPPRCCRHLFNRYIIVSFGSKRASLDTALARLLGMRVFLNLSLTLSSGEAAYRRACRYPVRRTSPSIARPSGVSGRVMSPMIEK